MTNPTKQTIEQYRQIIADAPDEATHVDINGHYWHNSSAFYWLCCDDGSTCGGCDIGNGIKSLDNLRTIVALYDENQAKGKRITELERELDRFREQTNEMNKGMLELNKRNEQLERELDDAEIKALEDLRDDINWAALHKPEQCKDVVDYKIKQLNRQQEGE